MSYLRKYSEDEYFRLLEASEYRIEYVDGFLFPMHDHGHTEPLTRLTSKHGLVCANLCALLHAPAKAAGLKLYSGTVRVKVRGYQTPAGKWAGRFQTPDLVMTAEAVAPTATHLVAPLCIAEVLSPRTRDADRWFKSEEYRALPSLRHYLLIDTATRAARLYTREQNGWAEQYAEGEGEIRLTFPPMTLTLADLYDGTSL